MFKEGTHLNYIEEKTSASHGAQMRGHAWLVRQVNSGERWVACLETTLGFRKVSAENKAHHHRISRDTREIRGRDPYRAS